MSETKGPNGNLKGLVEQMEHPGTATHLQELLQQVETLDEVAKTIHAFRDSQTDAMIERLAATVERLGSLADEIARPEAFEALRGAMNQVTELSRSGALDALAQMAALASAARDSMNESLVERTAGNLEQLGSLVSEAAKPDVIEALHGSLHQLTELHRSGALDALTQLAMVTVAVKNSLTDSLVERSADTLGKVAEIAEEVLKADLMRAMPALQELVNSGSLQILTQMATFVGSASHAFTDSIVERVLTIVENLTSRLVNPQIQDLIGAMVEGTHTTMEDMKQQPYDKTGLLGLLKNARDPEVQKGLLFVMNMAKNFHRSLSSVTGPRM